MVKFDLQNKISLFTCEAPDLEQISILPNQFRIIFVLAGEGNVLLDNDLIEYDQNNILLVRPEEQIIFFANEKTKVFIIEGDIFKNTSLKPGRPANGFANLFKHIQYIFFKSDSARCITIKSDADQNSVNNLILLITLEIDYNRKSSEEIIKNSVFLLINILESNLHDFKHTLNQPVRHEEVDLILNYIKEQIHKNKEVNVKEIENHFKSTITNIDRGIMAKTGLSFKNFVVKSKVEHFKNRLLKIQVYPV